MDSIVKGDYRIPLKVIKEWRRSIRISVGKTSVNLRVPVFLNAQSIDKQIELSKKWIDRLIIDSPGSLINFKERKYIDGQEISVNAKDYTIRIRLTENKVSTGKIKNGTILIMISDSIAVLDRNQMVRKLLRKLIAKDQLSEIKARVFEINDLYFQKRIENVRLKYNISNWGSCSSKKNINLSTRLLLAPKEIQDYVIIHELAHLVELNHSERFWSVVKNIDPDYKKKELWLKVNGHLCEI